MLADVHGVGRLKDSSPVGALTAECSFSDELFEWCRGENDRGKWNRELCFFSCASSFSSLVDDFASPSHTSISIQRQQRRRTYVRHRGQRPVLRSLLISGVVQTHSLKGCTYILVGIGAGVAVELIACEICIVAAVDEVIRDRIGQVLILKFRRSTALFRGNVLQELIQIMDGLGRGSRGRLLRRFVTRRRQEGLELLGLFVE